MSTSKINEMSLLDLFLLETGNQCVTLTHVLSAIGEGSGQVDYNTLQRAIHSIKGAARIVDLNLVIELTKSMEQVLQTSPSLADNLNLLHTLDSCVDQLSEIATTKATKLQTCLQEKKNILKNLINLLQNSSQQACELPTVKQKTREYSDTKPNSYGNLALFQIFKEDAENHLATLSEELIKIEKNPTSPTLLESSMRAVHSLKGAARIIELPSIVQLCHLMEDIFSSAQDNKILLGPDQIDAFFDAVDLLKDLIKTEEKALPGWFDNNTGKINAVIEQLHYLLRNSAPNNYNLQKTQTGPLVSATYQNNDPVGRQVTPIDNNLNNHTAPSHDRKLKISAKNLSTMLGLAGEAMVESRWLPTMVERSNRLKRKQDQLRYSIEKIRKHLIETDSSHYLKYSLDEVVRRMSSCQNYLSDQAAEIDDHARNYLDISHRLHREVITNRMQPFSEGIIGLPRMIRELGRQQDKSISLNVSGAETMIDRDVLRKLDSPLNHLITNAIDHGIESKEERHKADKPEEATITIEAKHVSGMMYITITDDGRGVDLAELRRKIIDRKLVSEKIARELKEHELYEFLFLPNFTTRKSVSKTSGRGVGLDIVHSTIREIRGSIQLTSIKGKGTFFEIRLPLTLSIIRGLIATINNEPYSFPLVSIDHVVRLPKSELKEMGNKQYFISKNKRIGIISAQQVLELKEHSVDDVLSIVVVNSSRNTYGLIVDNLQGVKDLVVQPLNPRLGKLRSVSAAAIAENGTPVLILDIHDLVSSMDHIISGNRLNRIFPAEDRDERSPVQSILVVDDSITVREVEKEILSTHGFKVETAVDGLEAWSLIRKYKYDLIITDIDMPNMNGIELVVQVKETSEFEDIPIIIVSYKDREEDKNRGLDAGADYYLTKASFQNQTLIDAVEDLIGPPISDNEMHNTE